MVPGLQAYLHPDGSNSRLVDVKLTATTHWPDIDVITCSDTESTLHLNIHAELAWFVGHFPEQPVLPGVVQTHWAGLLAQALFTRDAALQFSHLQRLKFNSVVIPEQQLLLTLQWHTERRRCTFRYLDKDNNAVSSGTLGFDQITNP